MQALAVMYECPCLKGGASVIFFVLSFQAMDTNRNYATVTWTTPTGSDNVGVISTEVTNSPGSTFLIGTHTVTYTVRDAAMNVGNCSFTVTVGDTQPPVVTCPSNVAQVQSVLRIPLLTVLWHDVTVRMSTDIIRK